jgi:hypothetical protein
MMCFHMFVVKTQTESVVRNNLTYLNLNEFYEYLFSPEVVACTCQVVTCIQTDGQSSFIRCPIKL